MWQVFGFQLPSNLAETPARLIEAQASMRAEMDTTSPVDPFEFPIELIWDRMPEVFRQEPLRPEIENALYRIYYGRGFFYVHWSPLRAYQLRYQPGGETQIEAARVSRTQELANTGAAIIAASTVIERCLDLAAQLARAYLGEPLRERPQNQPIERLADAREVIGRLSEDPEIGIRILKIVGGEVSSIAEPAIRSACQSLIRDPFPLIDLLEGVVPTEDVATLLRHMWAHARDQDFTLVSRGTFGQFAEAMGHFYNLTTWLLVASSLGGACHEWSAVASR